MKKIALLSCIVFFFQNALATDLTDPLEWPMEIKTSEGEITLYQPQIEKFENNRMEGRLAVSVNTNGELLFGAMWFEARMETDLDKRTVHLIKMEIPNISFPNVEDQAKINKLRNYLTSQIESWNLTMSLDRILGSIENDQYLQKDEALINNTAPHVLYRTTPTVLVSIDGKPITKEENGLEYVVNTPFFIVRENNKKVYYLNGGQFWYASEKINGPWSESTKVPSNIKQFAEKMATQQEEQDQDSLANTLSSAPAIVVATEPTELIVSDGKAEYASIKDTQLLYISNSENDVIMELNSQIHYILIAGRWYTAPSLESNEWKFIEPKDLPEDFKNIPNNSDMASVRVNIPDTPEAKDALLEQSVPQTATVDRKTATVEVQYDGDPKFEKIDATKVAYALNSDKTVLQIDKTFYCIDNGIYFESTKATGPWKVSTKRPDEVDEIPPSSPVYNVKYVYIYDSTPEVVYVGYLPGYTASYVYGGVVVYGTGYYYQPWYHHYYYPRPVTYGFGIHYSTYGGWGFSYGFSYGWIGWSYHRHAAWWGPCGYRYGYRHGYHHGYRHGYNRGYNRGYAHGYMAGRHNANRNVYQNRNNGVRKSISNRPSTNDRNLNNKSRPSTRQNNVMTDKKGNVYQRDNKGNWNSRDNRPSNKSGNRPSTQPSTRPSNKQQLDRSYQNRNRSNKNYNNYQKQQRSRPSNVNRGGGRRRR